MKKQKLYEQTRWRLSLIILALVVVATSISYTNTVAYQLKTDEQKNVKLWVLAQTEMMNPEYDGDITLHSEVVNTNTHIPIILTDEYYRIVDARNYGDRDPFQDTAFFNAELAYLKSTQEPILVGDGVIKNYLFHKQSTLITTLEWFPYLQFLILGILLMISYFTFSFNRQAEQERVWVGMAKETAHQLGTPITSLMGWIENIKMMYEQDEDLMMMADEMNTDIDLLKLVADRFSKIGTTPDLQPVDIFINLEKHYNYVRQRASRKITFDFPKAPQTPITVQINPLLFDWVIENLLKNALDAMEGKGHIQAQVHQDESFVNIDIHDSGKGIPKKSFKTVFQPGYSTKKRGWGLGLSLCKRIVEKYHNGKIFVLDSAEGKGTTFRIQLPQVKQ